MFYLAHEVYAPEREKGNVSCEYCRMEWWQTAKNGKSLMFINAWWHKRGLGMSLLLCVKKPVVAPKKRAKHTQGRPELTRGSGNVVTAFSIQYS